MKKLLSTLCLVVLISCCCFAEMSPTFDQKSECLLVDLSSTRFVRHTDTAEWHSGTGTDAEHYYDNQILCVLGIVGDKAKSGDVSLSAELVSGEWAYILGGTDTRYKRPFGIQIIGRRKINLTDTGNDKHQNLGTEYNIYMGGGSAGTTSQVVIPQEVASQYEGIWWDMVLVFDYNVDTENDTVRGADGLTYNLVGSDIYYTAIVKLTIVWGTGEEEKAEYNVYLNGYYKSSNTSSGSGSSVVSTLNIDKLTTGNSIDIKTLFNSYSAGAAATAQAKQDVATYSFTTNTTSGRMTGDVSFFLSSVSSGINSGASEFILRHINSDGSTSYRDTNHNAVKFYAYIDSERGHSSAEATSVQGTSVQFDGTTVFSSQSISSNYVVVEADVYQDQDSGWHTRWHDTGTISVSIPTQQTINGNEVTIDGLIAGQYFSNIYFHVVTNI